MTILAIAQKELVLYFGSFLFYALAAVFLVVSGLNFHQSLEFFVRFGGMDLNRGLWQWLAFDMQNVLFPLLPLLTTRLFAEERKLGTLELLWTYPVRDLEIIAGKYLACVAVVTLMLLPALAYPAILALVHPVDVGPVAAAFLGLWLLAAAFVACGLFFSSLTDSQFVAGATTYGVLFFFWIMTWNEAAISEGMLRVLLPLSLFDRFETFTRGAIDTSDLAYLVLFTTAFLGFTVLALDARRWRGLR